MKLLLTAVLVATMLGVPAVAQQDHPLGAPRDDLDRFYGLYGTPGDETGRNYRVAPAKAPMWMERLDIPQGYLMLSPTWGDGQLWFMASVGDARFERRLKGDFGADTVVRFETGANGRAEAMVFELGPDDRKRLERLGDLPSK